MSHHVPTQRMNPFVHDFVSSAYHVAIALCVVRLKKEHLINSTRHAATLFPSGTLSDVRVHLKHSRKGILCLRGMTGITVIVPDGRSYADAIKGSNLHGTGLGEGVAGGPSAGVCSDRIHHAGYPRAERVC